MKETEKIKSVGEIFFGNRENCILFDFEKKMKVRKKIIFLVDFERVNCIGNKALLGRIEVMKAH